MNRRLLWKVLVICLAGQLCTVKVAWATKIRITGIDDINLGGWSGSGGLAGSDLLCVTVRPAGPYRISAYGSGSGGGLNLSSGGFTMEYQLFFNDRPREQGRRRMDQLSPLINLQAAPSFRNCNRGPNAYIGIEITSQVLESAAPGIYQGTLVLVVGPE